MRSLRPTTDSNVLAQHDASSPVSSSNQTQMRRLRPTTDSNVQAQHDASSPVSSCTFIRLTMKQSLGFHACYWQRRIPKRRNTQVAWSRWTLAFAQAWLDRRRLRSERIQVQGSTCSMRQAPRYAAAQQWKRIRRSRDPIHIRLRASRFGTRSGFEVRMLV